MPSTIPGTAIKDGIDAFAEVRETEAFKALKKHGVAERLAFAWIREKGEQAVLDMVAYTEERDAKNLINTNTRAYMQSLVKAGAEFGQSTYDKEKSEVIVAKAIEVKAETQKARLVELENQYQAARSRQSFKALTLEDRHAHAQAWFLTPEGQGRETDYIRDKSDFRDVVNRAKFLTYLRKAIHRPYVLEEFQTWLKEVKKIDPVQFSL